MEQYLFLNAHFYIENNFLELLKREVNNTCYKQVIKINAYILVLVYNAINFE